MATMDLTISLDNKLEETNSSDRKAQVHLTDLLSYSHIRFQYTLMKEICHFWDRNRNKMVVKSFILFVMISFVNRQVAREVF